MTEKWILRQVAAKTLPPQIANRPKTMFRALHVRRHSWARPARLGRSVAQPRVAPSHGLFRPGRPCARERYLQGAIPRITPARTSYDVALTCVVSTQLWHHIYCGGGLCDLPTWQPPVPKGLERGASSCSAAIAQPIIVCRRRRGRTGRSGRRGSCLGLVARRWTSSSFQKALGVRFRPVGPEPIEPATGISRCPSGGWPAPGTPSPGVDSCHLASGCLLPAGESTPRTARRGRARLPACSTQTGL